MDEMKLDPDSIKAADTELRAAMEYEIVFLARLERALNDAPLIAMSASLAARRSV